MSKFLHLSLCLSHPQDLTAYTMIESVCPETSILYFRLSMSRVVESDEVIPGCVVDFNADGDIVGIEFFV